MPGVTHPVGAYFLTTVTGPAGIAIDLGQTLAGTPSRFQHAGIVVDGDGTTVEAEPGGARYGKLYDYHDRPLLVCDGPVQMELAQFDRGELYWDGDRQSLEHYLRGEVAYEARGFVGIGYSALDYIALGLLHLHLPSRWVARRVVKSGHVICSQLVDAAYERASIHLYDDGRLPGDVTPADLDRWAQQHGPTIGGAS